MHDADVDAEPTPVVVVVAVHDEHYDCWNVLVLVLVVLVGCCIYAVKQGWRRLPAAVVAAAGWEVNFEETAVPY